MAEIALLVGTAVSAFGSISAGNSANKAAEQEAANELVIAEHNSEMLKRNAQHERAAASFAANEQQDITDLTISKQIARAAAGGGGVTNPTVLDIIEDTVERGEILKGVEIFKGEQRARGLLDQADVGLLNANNRAGVLRDKGKAKQKAGFFKAATTVIGGAGKSTTFKAAFG